MSVATLRVMVVDDEQPARNDLCDLLGEASDVEVAGQASDGIEALRLIGSVKPDLVFLDVQMPGLTGFEVARRLLSHESAPAVVFVTAFNQYAIEAFDVNAVHYLLKPVDQDRLELTLDKVRKQVARLHPSPGELERVIEHMHRFAGVLPGDLERAVDASQARVGRRDQVAIRVGDKFVLVAAGEISHASVVDDTLVVATNTMSGTSSYRTLDELHARLDPAIFWRVHRSHLVNIMNIREIVPWFSRNYLLKMKDAKASEIPVSRAQTKRLREYLHL